MHSLRFVNPLQIVCLPVIETIGEYIKMNGTIIGFNKLFLCACSVDETLAWHFYGVKPDKKKKNWSCSQILDVDYELF